jgi:hypothetical protein
LERVARASALLLLLPPYLVVFLHLRLISPFAVVIDDIVDVRKGWKTDTFNKMEQTVKRKSIKSPGRKHIINEATCFSVVHGQNKQSLDLVAPNVEVAELWVRGLRHLITVLRGLKQEERFERQVLYMIQ